MKRTPIAVNLKTGKPARWPRFPYDTGTDHARFHCVWNATHYTLCSFSDHLKHNVPPEMFLLLDARYRYAFAPKSEVSIGYRV